MTTPDLSSEYKIEREKHIRASCQQSHTGTKGICELCWELIRELRNGENV